MTVDDLTEYGVEQMDDAAIGDFLSSQRVGVLGLPSEGAPTMRPLSFAYDGADSLYLLYVVGSGSRKRDLSDRAAAARVLVYSAETPFNWRSVLLTGSIDAVSDEEVTALEESLSLPWQPDLLRAAAASEETRLYRFGIGDRQGLRHAGLPEKFDAEAGDEREWRQSRGEYAGVTTRPSVVHHRERRLDAAAVGERSVPFILSIAQLD